MLTSFLLTPRTAGAPARVPSANGPAADACANGDGPHAGPNAESDEPNGDATDGVRSSRRLADESRRHGRPSNAPGRTAGSRQPNERWPHGRSHGRRSGQRSNRWTCHACCPHGSTGDTRDGPAARARLGRGHGRRQSGLSPVLHRTRQGDSATAALRGEICPWSSTHA